jgi:hypothetical protein
MNRLEDSYRRLLSAYPPEFRAEHGEELLGVLLAAAPDSQTRPGFRDTVDVLWNGMVLRTRRLFGAIPAKLLERVGLLSLAGGTALSTLCLVFGELGPKNGWDSFIDLRFATVYSTGSALYALWLLVVGLLVTGLVRNARRAVAVLTGGVGLLALASRLVPTHVVAAPPAYLIGLLAGLAAMSLGLPRTLDRPGRALLGGVSLAWSLAMVSTYPAYFGGFTFYRGYGIQNVVSSSWSVVTLLCLAGGIASVRRPGWVMATVLASVPWVCFALLFVFGATPYPWPAWLFLAVLTVGGLFMRDSKRTEKVRAS